MTLAEWPAILTRLAVLLVVVASLTPISFQRSTVNNYADAAVSSRALPDLVVVIRHAEKPVSGHHLNASGWERARALAPYLWNHYGTHLAAVYASQVDPAVHSPSFRPQETVTPLMTDLRTNNRGVAFNTSWPKGKEPEMVADIERTAGYAGKIVLIAWEHGSIPRIAAALGVPDPPMWPDRYDLIMEVDMTQSSPKCRWVAQMLMPGDTPTLPTGCGTP